MQTIQVTFTAEVPEDLTSREIKKWLAYRLGNCNSLETTNPLTEKDLEATHFWWHKHDF